jgi:hypothetical protein
MDCSAIGETTHLAARMEQIAAPGTILATSRVLRAAGEYVTSRPLGPAPAIGDVAGTATPHTRSRINLESLEESTWPPAPGRSRRSSSCSSVVSPSWRPGIAVSLPHPVANVLGRTSRLIA